MKKISGWGIFGICVLAIVLILGFWGVGSYNNLVSLKENVDSKYSDIDVQLQRRSNLIPNIVNTVKGYTSHESKILDEIANSRSKLASASTVSSKASADSELSSAVSKLMVVVENYPDLKADTQFTTLMDNLEGTENRIATARKDYNEAVQGYNKSIKMFPNSLIAGMCGFAEAERFEADQNASQTPQVNFN